MLFVNEFTNPKGNLLRRNCLPPFEVNMEILPLEKDFETELFLMANKPTP